MRPAVWGVVSCSRLIAGSVSAGLLGAVCLFGSAALADVTIGGKTYVDLTTDGAGTASSDAGVYYSYTMLGAFDNSWDSTQKRALCPYNTTYPGMYVDYAFNMPTVVNAYSIRAAGVGSGAPTPRGPKDWTLEGSDDEGANKTWTVLDTRTGVTGWSAAEVRLYKIVNTHAYKNYRFSCTELNGRTDCIEFHELEYYYVEELNLGDCTATGSSAGIDVSATMAMATASSITAYAQNINGGDPLSKVIGTNVAAHETATGTISDVIADNAYTVYVVATDGETTQTNQLGAVYTGNLVLERTVGPTDDYVGEMTNSLWNYFNGKIVLSKGEYPLSKELVLPAKVSVVGQTGKPEDVVLYADRSNKQYRTLSLSGDESFVANVVISNGCSSSEGANLAMTGGTVSNCVLKAASLSGNNGRGSVYLNGTNALLTHCVIDGAQALGADSGWMNEYGVGVFVEKGRVENTLVKNAHTLSTTKNISSGADPKNTTAKKSAGGIYLAGNVASAVNCTVVDCSASVAGGIWVKSGAVARNCVVANCQTGGVWEVGGEFVFAHSAIVSEGTVDHCATDDEAKFNDTCVIGTVATFFMDSGAGDYTPASESPLIKAGVVPDGWNADGFTDLAGRPRVTNGRICIGAYECAKVRGLVIIIR